MCPLLSAVPVALSENAILSLWKITLTTVKINKNKNKSKSKNKRNDLWIPASILPRLLYLHNLRQKMYFSVLLPFLTPKEIYAPKTLPAIVENPAVMTAWSSDLVMYGK